MFCTECEDTSATLLCLGCEEEYCQLCWESLHRRGARAKHVTRPLNSTLVAGAIAGMGGARPAPEACTDGSSDEGENVVGSSDETVTKRPRAQADDHEAPLCPSGHFFSKTLKDPSVSPSAPKRAKLASPRRVEVALVPASSDSPASERMTSPEREGKRGYDGKGREKRSRSLNSGDEKLPKFAKSQTPSSPGEASQSVIAADTAKAVEAETSPCSHKADCSGVASGGSGGGCSTVAESALASLGPSTSPEREEKGGGDGNGWEKRSRSPNSRDEELPKVSPGEASQTVIAAETAKAVEAETSPCSQKADCSGVASGGSGGGCSTVAESTSASASLGPSKSPERDEKDGDDGKGREKRPRSPNPGDQKLAKVAKSQALSSPGEAGKAVDAEISPRSQEADSSGVASGGGCCATVAASAEGIKGASPGPSVLEAEEDVGRARVPTEVEKVLLASMSRRSKTVPLRLDAREREILGVLTGALDQSNYTDEVDLTTLEGTRLDPIVRNLKRFFTSIWGLFTASGVRATPMRVTSPPHQQPPHHGTDRQCGAGITGREEPPFGTSASGWRFLRGSSSAGGALRGNADRLATPRGSGARAADAAASKGECCGAGSYRADSFSLQKSGMELTKEWMYILMDAEHPDVKRKTGFSCLRAMRTVRGLSESSSLLGMFDDPDLISATMSVLPWKQGQVLGRPTKEAAQIATETGEKAKARKRLLARHGKKGLEGEVSLVIDSLADSIVSRDMTTMRMMALLKANWTPGAIDESKDAASIAIRSGEHGSRLTHDHGTQFHFVVQSLHLWLAVADNMLDLWALGEVSMLGDGSQYSLEDTGQGLQRVQAAPKLGAILQKVQQRVEEHTKKSWVGSPVIHLGDNCVPNALVFLDKYCQVSTILNAILQVVDYLDDLDEGKDPQILEFIRTRWQTVDSAKRHILQNFFRSGFDGSGAANNNDAGNCVDGRLTSVWNWCSELETKDFYHLFMCSGFRGFNGDFSS